MTNANTEQGWQKPLEEWRRIFNETPDYDCWPAPIRGWEVGAFVKYIDKLESELTATRRALTMIMDYAGHRAYPSAQYITAIAADALAGNQ